MSAQRSSWFLPRSSRRLSSLLRFLLSSSLQPSGHPHAGILSAYHPSLAHILSLCPTNLPPFSPFRLPRGRCDVQILPKPCINRLLCTPAQLLLLAVNPCCGRRYPDEEREDRVEVARDEVGCCCHFGGAEDISGIKLSGAGSQGR